MKSWARRALELHGELRAVADMTAIDPRWWLLAGTAALPWQARGAYVISDAEPAADTFIGHPVEPVADHLAWAIASAHATREAIRELDGALPEQPLAVTIERGVHGAVTLPSRLDMAAIACGDRVVQVALDGEIGVAAPRGRAVPFVTISLGEEPIATARHGHRRGWMKNGVSSGPWLGVARSGGLDLVSTCHMAVDGYGHAWLAARIAEHRRRLLPRVDRAAIAWLAAQLGNPARTLAPVTEAYPLAVAWRVVDEPVRALPLAYQLGCLLHRLAGNRDARFSPTLQIPVAAGPPGDPLRRRYRHVPALASVRFSRGSPEPYEMFDMRTRAQLEREIEGDGVSARLLATARAVPAPLAWKRQAIGGNRPPWLSGIAEVLGGRACLSKIRLDEPIPPSCAVSAPAAHDALGGCVVTVVEDDHRATITLCGTGRIGAAGLLDELFAPATGCGTSFRR